ncbi:MAG: cyclic pyranopterin monophosphate synthase MoaC [Myxococcota bacterium]
MASKDRQDDARGGLTHVDAEGTARMVDVSPKAATVRTARARAVVEMQPETARAIAEARLEKGDLVAVSRVAGVMGAKRTADLIPLCHPLPLDHVDVDLTVEEARVVIETEARVTARTGIEMEALTAATVAALTVYDMAKAVDRSMRITGVVLLDKHGGRSGSWVRDEEA